MRVLATALFCGCFLAQAAAVEWQDDFNGGMFDQPWDFLGFDGSAVSNPPAHTDTVIIDDALELLGRDADYPLFDQFAAGLVGLTSDPGLAFPDAVQLTATFIPTMNHSLSGFLERGNNDVFLLARSHGFSGYVLALDAITGSFDLVRSDNGDPSNIADGLVVPDFDPDATYIMRLTAEGDKIRGEIFDSSMNLLLDAYATDDTYSDGFAGLGSAINADLVDEGDFSATLVTGRYDDVLATDENIVPMQSLFPSGRIDQRSPTSSALNAVEVRDFNANETIREAMKHLIAAAPGDRHEGTIATFDIHDPDGGGVVGAVDSPPQAILTDQVGLNDDDFVQLLSGSFEVPETAAGDITFNVHSDDAFALRVFYDKGAGGAEDLVPVPFSRIGDRGIITSEGAISFTEGTGDSNVQAAIDLAQGSYSFEMAWIDFGGGAFAEVSTAFGDFVDDPGAASWVLLGDAAGLPLVDGLGTGPNVVTGIDGDYNNNGRVEQGDLDLVLLNWGQPFDTLPDTWSHQRPQMGIVDQSELDGVLLNWGSTGGLATAAGVPEPATLLLVVLCGLLAGCRVWGRR